MGKNVTLHLDKSIIRQAKHAAAEQEQSLSEWVAGLITHAVSKNNRLQSTKEKALQLMKQGFHLGGNSLTREEAHER
jgi:hypothetical protein